MKPNLVLITAITLFTLFSCNQAKQDSVQTQEVPALPPNQEQAPQVSTQPAQPVMNETAAQPSTEQNNTEVMLNPPHGEPYHRCDIPVGTPLSSPPANATQQTTSNQVQATAPQTSGSAQSLDNNPYAPTVENDMRINRSQAPSSAPANKGSKPRLNPPHGQPWHRCDIAVGSQLP